MSKALVAYFSASGVTAKLAKTLAQATGGDLFEIEPAQRYAAADLDWMDKHSRSTVEMKDKNARPAIASTVENMAQYDTVYVGFPIWWYEAPRRMSNALRRSGGSCGTPCRPCGWTVWWARPSPWPAAPPPS